MTIKQRPHGGSPPPILNVSKPPGKKKTQQYHYKELQTHKGFEIPVHRTGIYPGPDQLAVEIGRYFKRGIKICRKNT